MAFDAFLRGSTATTAMGRDATRTCSSPRPTLGGIRAQRRGVACAGGNGSARVSWLFPVTGRITANCSPAGSPGEFRVSAVCDSRICPRREKRTNRECDSMREVQQSSCDDGDDRIRSPTSILFPGVDIPFTHKLRARAGRVHLRVGLSRRRNHDHGGRSGPVRHVKPIKPKSAVPKPNGASGEGKAETLEEFASGGGGNVAEEEEEKKTEELLERINEIVGT